VVDVAAAGPLTDAAPMSATAEFELVIGGMTCAACAARVITAELIAVVEATGYAARLAVPAEPDAWVSGESRTSWPSR
jgi:hypothetical protein